jgi:hypothetical protein
MTRAAYDLANGQSVWRSGDLHKTRSVVTSGHRFVRAARPTAMVQTLSSIDGSVYSDDTGILKALWHQILADVQRAHELCAGVACEIVIFDKTHLD